MTNVNTPLLVQVPLTSIDENIKTYQVRQHGISEDHVESLVNSNPEKWEAVILHKFENDTFAIVSGFHRVEAAKRLNLATIKAEIIVSELTHNQLELTAYRFNSEHGLPLTMSEKKKYAVLLHLEKPEMAHYKIAQIVHISDKTVTTAIEEYNKWLEEQTNPDGAGTDDETEGVGTEDETEEQLLEKMFSSFVKAVRKFEKEALVDTTHDRAVTLLAQCMNKVKSSEYDGDASIFELVAITMTEAALSKRPKPVTPEKKTKKTTKASSNKDLIATLDDNKTNASHA